MKTIRTLLLCLTIMVATLLSGCYLKSVHPLVTDSDLVLIEGLDGRYESEDQRWTFINDPAKIPDLNIADMTFDGEEEEETPNYYIVLFENLQDISSDTTYFIGKIGSFNNHYFLDMFLFDLSGSSNFMDAHKFPVHTFSRIRLDGNDLSIQFFEDSWLEDQIDNNRIRIKHESTEDGILVTASTKELQRFVNKYADEEDAFDDAMILTRKES
ncbi:MAG: hypothetical protein AAFW89_01750 [Bacteroidota bacterium]